MRNGFRDGWEELAEGGAKIRTKGIKLLLALYSQ